MLPLIGIILLNLLGLICCWHSKCLLNETRLSWWPKEVIVEEWIWRNCLLCSLSLRFNYWGINGWQSVFKSDRVPKRWEICFCCPLYRWQILCGDTSVTSYERFRGVLIVFELGSLLLVLGDHLDQVRGLTVAFHNWVASIVVVDSLHDRRDRVLVLSRFLVHWYDAQTGLFLQLLFVVLPRSVQIVIWLQLAQMVIPWALVHCLSN